MTGSGDETAALVRAGSHDAFAATFDAYAADVFGFLARRCGSRSQAEDLLSVVFLEAWRCRARAQAVDGTLRPWLFGIATNVLRNAGRAARRHAAALDRYAAGHRDDATPDIADDAVRGADEGRDRATLRGALDRLPRRERAVADLCLVGELSADAASAVLGIPVATVRSRLARARKRLRADLRPAT